MPPALACGASTHSRPHARDLDTEDHTRAEGWQVLQATPALISSSENPGRLGMLLGYKGFLFLCIKVLFIYFFLMRTRAL